jgi:hypothetical protein
MSGVPDVREADPHDRRDPRDLLLYNPPPPPPREVLPRFADPGDPHPYDPRDSRDSTDPRNVVHGSGFTFPERGRTGQTVTNTYGQVYQFDGDQWLPGASVTAATYTFRIGIDETSPGIVDVMPATISEIGGLLEPPADSLPYARSNTGTTRAWVPLAPITALTLITLAPDIAVVGGADLTVVANGVNFTNTTQIVWDGAPVATTFVSPAQVTFVVQPSLESAARSVPVTVQDGATAGVGIAFFTFAMSSAGVVISDTAPPTPTAGMLWWQSSTGKFFVYYNDGTSSQFVQCGGP